MAILTILTTVAIIGIAAIIAVLVWDRSLAPKEVQCEQCELPAEYWSARTHAGREEQHHLCTKHFEVELKCLAEFYRCGLNVNWKWQRLKPSKLPRLTCDECPEDNAMFYLEYGDCPGCHEFGGFVRICPRCMRIFMEQELSAQLDREMRDSWEHDCTYDRNGWCAKHEHCVELHNPTSMGMITIE